MKAMDWECENEMQLDCKKKKDETADGMKFVNYLGPLYVYFYIYPF